MCVSFMFSYFRAGEEVRVVFSYFRAGEEVRVASLVLPYCDVSYAFAIFAISGLSYYLSSSSTLYLSTPVPYIQFCAVN